MCGGSGDAIMATDRVVVPDQQDMELKKQLERIDFHLDYGSVRIQVRAGKVTQVTIERTVRVD